MSTACDKELQRFLPESAPNLHLQWTSPHLLCHSAMLSLKEKGHLSLREMLLAYPMCLPVGEFPSLLIQANNKPHTKVIKDNLFLISVPNFMCN